MPAVPSMEEFNERIVPALEAANLPRFETPLGRAISVVQLVRQLVRQHYLGYEHGDNPDPSVFPRLVRSQFAPYKDHRGEVSREQWLTALESDQHRQIHGALIGQITNTHRADPDACQSAYTCCLGVAPKLLNLPFAHGQTLAAYRGTSSAITEDAAYLIEGLREHEVSLAMALNDSAVYNFQQIATVFRILWDMPRPSRFDD